MFFKNAQTPLVAQALRNRRFVPAAVWLAGLLLILADPGLPLYGPTPWAHALEQAPQPVINVAVERGLLTVDARNAPLADVLRVIGERADLKVTFYTKVEVLVTQLFSDVPLNEGINRLLHRAGLSAVMTYALPQGGTGGRLLTAVQVFQPASAPSPDKPVDSTEQHRTAPSQTWVAWARARGVHSPHDPYADFADEGEPVDWVYWALDQPERSTRLPAVGELRYRAHAGDELARAALAKILGQDGDPFLRRRAATALGSIEGEEARDALEKALGDQYASVRIRAVRGLRHLGDKRAPELLGRVLLRDPNPHVRGVAAWTLAAFPSEAAHGALKAATLDHDESVRQTAARVLAQWESQSITPGGDAN